MVYQLLIQLNHHGVLIVVQMMSFKANMLDHVWEIYSVLILLKTSTKLISLIKLWQSNLNLLKRKPQ